MKPKLIAIDGSLHTAIEDAEPRYNQWRGVKPGDEPWILIHIYPEGDCDTVPWPLPPERRELLACALFGARETGQLAGYPASVLLPDGEEFHIEANLK